MQIVTRLIALRRSIQLNRQFREIQREIDGFPVATQRELARIVAKEFAAASDCEAPHLYGTVPEDQGLDAWGKGSEIGFSRVKSDNRHVKLRGIALWLTVAFFETRESPYGEALTLHRQLMRTLRVLKESAPKVTQAERWMSGQPENRAIA